jgi:hypothetical protein
VEWTAYDPVDGCPATSAADAWLRAVTSGDHRTAWSLIDPDLRLAFAQAWILQTLGRTGDDALADRLASSNSNEPVWAACVRSNGEIWRSAHKSWEVCGWRAHSQPAGPALGTLVRVALAINQSAEVASTADELPLQHFLMRRRDAWRIAGIGQLVARPGWPPTLLSDP